MTAGLFEMPPNDDGNAGAVLKTYTPDELASVKDR